MSMEFVPSDPGPAPTLPQPTPGPTSGEVIGAAFRQGNPIVSAFSAMRNSGPYEPQEGYSAWDEIKDDPAYQAHQDEFAGFRSPAETQALKDRIDREERDKRILAASGASGFLASMIAGTLDPTLLLPGRIAITAAKEGVGLVRGAMEVGGAMALQSGAQELALQATQETRTAGESILNVGSATVLGALLGGAAAHLSPAEHASLVAGLDAERTTMDARAAGLPEPNDPIWFHGTSAQFKNFDLDVVRRTGEPDIAIALSSSRDLARGYASKDGRIIEVKTNFKNPMIVRQEGYGSRYQNARLIEEAKAKGHDGLIFEFSDPSYLNDGTEIPPSREVLAWEAGTLVDAKTGENLLGGQEAPQPQAQSLEDRIRQAYFVVGGGKWGARVTLADLRKQLPDVPREEMDRALKALNNDENSNAVLYQNDNRAMVSPEEDAGALHIGKDPRHLLFISGPRTLEGTGFGTGFFPTSGGAAAADTREAKLVGAGGLEKLGTDPVMRGLNSPLVTARRATSDLAEVSVELEQNLRGETTTLGGGPSVETAVRVAKFTTDNAILDEMKRQWTDLRFQGQKAPWFAEFRDRMGWLGRSPELPTFEQFDKMVAEANTKNDTHAIPQVQAAAQFIRNRVAQWSDRAEQALEGFQKTTPIEGEGYFPHDWNSQLIRAQRPEFVNFLTGIFDATQRTKRDIQARIQAFNDQLISHETNIKKLTTQLEKKRAAKVPVTELEDLENKLNNAHTLAGVTRKKIEDEIGKWEGKSTAEAKSAIKTRAKYEAERTAAAVAKGEKPPTTRLASADDAVDAAVKRILASDQNLDVEALRAKAHDTTDHILGTPDGRIYGEGAGVQFGPQLRSTDLRGSEMRRTINVSNAEAWPWINQDAQRVWRKYVNTMAPDVMIAERFGDVAMTEPIQKILDEHAALSDATKAPAERRKLDKAKDAAIRDIAGLRDRLRGVYALPQNDTQRMIGRVSAAVRNLNVPMSMGMSAAASFGDAAGVMMRWGMMSAFRDGFMPYVQSLMTDQKLSRAALREFRTAGIAIDTQFAARHHEISGITDAYQNGSPVERALQWGADKMQLANMLGPWTDRIKTISATVAATNFLKAAEALIKGTATQKQLRALGAANIDRNLAARIAEQYRTYGNRVDGVLLPNLAEWTDRSAREAFNGALSREANIMVVTPGIDKPLLMSDPMVAMLTQFKSYTAAAHTRILIANLQRRDADALGGLVGALGLGMLSYKINALTGGQPTSDKPADWIKEGMSRSNLLGWFEEANAFSSKMTRGRLDAYRLTGSQHMLSKYAGRSALDQILGPTAGKIERLATVTGAAASMDWKASDTHALRQLFFLQNLVYLRQLFDQVEHGVNRGLRVEEKTRQ